MKVIARTTGASIPGLIRATAANWRANTRQIAQPITLATATVQTSVYVKSSLDVSMSGPGARP